MSSDAKKPPLAARITHDVLGGIGAFAVLYALYRVMEHLVHRG